MNRDRQVGEGVDVEEEGDDGEESYVLLPDLKRPGRSIALFDDGSYCFLWAPKE